MASKKQPCKYCDHSKFEGYPFGEFCIIHHDHCDSRELGLTQNQSEMLHRAWHRLEACLDHMKDDPRDAKLWLMSWQVGAILRAFSYLPTPPPYRNWKPRDTYHKVWIGATNGANKKVRFRKIQEMQKMLDTLEVLKKLQEPSTYVEGEHKIVSEKKIPGL